MVLPGCAGQPTKADGLERRCCWLYHEHKEQIAVERHGEVMTGKDQSQ